MMRRIGLCLLAISALAALMPSVALAGVEPSPFAPGLYQELWTAPGLWQEFNPQPEPPAFSVRGQLNIAGAPPVAPGMARDLWTAPGLWQEFNPQPEPPAFTPLMQMNVLPN